MLQILQARKQNLKKEVVAAQYLYTPEFTWSVMGIHSQGTPISNISLETEYPN
jgi:hypothetical protein